MEGCYNNASRVPNLLQVLATEFVEIPCEVLFGDAERVGGELGAKGADAGEGLREGRGLERAGSGEELSSKQGRA